MLTDNQLLKIANCAATVAASVLSLSSLYTPGTDACKIYTVRLINDPSFTEDGLFI